jgi:hypothetical protein
MEHLEAGRAPPSDAIAVARGTIRALGAHWIGSIESRCGNSSKKSKLWCVVEVKASTNRK